MFYKRLQLAAIFMLLLTLPAAYLVSQLTVDNRQEKLVNQSGDAALRYQQFKQDFGQDEFVIMALSGRDIFNVDVLDDALLLVEHLEAIEQVVSVNGVPVIYRDLFGEEDADALREEMTGTDFYRNLLISDDTEVAGLMLQLGELSSVEQRQILVDGIESVAATAREQGFRVDLVGQPIFSVSINRITSHETSRTFPIAGVLALLLLLALLRSVPAALTVLVCGGLALLYTMAVVSLVGWEMNLITTSLPLVLFVLAIANGIHVAARYQRTLHTIPDRAQAMEATLRELIRSCVLSSVTTALGFLSLMVADLDAIAQMGIYMSLGILFSLLTNFTVGAWLLLVLKVAPAHGGGERLGTLLERRVAFAMRFPRAVIFGFAMLAIAGVSGLLNTTSSGDSLQFLPKGHALTASHQFVSDRLTGLTAIELVVETPGGWLNEHYWDALAQLTTDVGTIPTVKRVYSPLTLLSKMNQWSNGGDAEFYTLPPSRADAEGILTLLDESNAGQLASYATQDGERIRISILANLRGDAATSQLIHDIEQISANLPQPLRAYSTGIAVQMGALSEGLLATQMTSYALALLLIFATIGIGLKSRHLLLLSILPNVMPMLVIFLLMWLLSIAINTATVMVASISLGIAVDNTVHFLTRFRTQRRSGESPQRAAQTTITQVGPSITITTLTACLGFFALIPSAFEPISNLGLLSGSAILMALIANLLLLPAIIALSPEERRNAYR